MVDYLIGILQLLAILLFIGGGIGTLALAGDKNPIWLTSALSTVIGSLLLFSLAQALDILLKIQEASERSAGANARTANALESIARRQQKVALPADEQDKRRIHSINRQ